MADAFSKAWSVVKDTATATRSAELWVMNDEETYFAIIQLIKEQVRGHLNMGWSRDEVKQEVLERIATSLPETMAHHEGFMEELGGPVTYGDEIGDGISDVDWYEVAQNFDEDIDEAINDYPEEWA
jgi:hypothetical protein